MQFALSTSFRIQTINNQHINQLNIPNLKHFEIVSLVYVHKSNDQISYFVAHFGES